MTSPRSGFLHVLYSLLNPLPFGFFLAGLIFDYIYNVSGEIMWAKSASWLIAMGLVFAIIPRLINLYYVWFKPDRFSIDYSRLGFWLYAFAVVIQILNSFVHSRDAYGIAPTNLTLSILAVLLVAITYIYQAMGSRQPVRLAGE